MKRREFIKVLGGALFAALGGAEAQTAPEIHRVGLLTPAAPKADNSPFGVPLVRGLAQHGYVHRVRAPRSGGANGTAASSC